MADRRSEWLNDQAAVSTLLDAIAFGGRRRAQAAKLSILVLLTAVATLAAQLEIERQEMAKREVAQQEMMKRNSVAQEDTRRNSASPIPFRLVTDATLIEDLRARHLPGDTASEQNFDQRAALASTDWSRNATKLRTATDAQTRSLLLEKKLLSGSTNARFTQIRKRYTDWKDVAGKYLYYAPAVSAEAEKYGRAYWEDVSFGEYQELMECGEAGRLRWSDLRQVQANALRYPLLHASFSMLLADKETTRLCTTPLGRKYVAELADAVSELRKSNPELDSELLPMAEFSSCLGPE